MITPLLVSFLFLIGIALMLLNAAIECAVEGREDANGFHGGELKRHFTTVASETEAMPWDYVEGTCCPLNFPQ